MSLLIKALEQAAKDRTSQRHEAQSLAGPRTYPGLASEPLLEPAPSPRSAAPFDEPPVHDVPSSTPSADLAGASSTGPRFDSPRRPQRRAPSNSCSSDRAEHHEPIQTNAAADGLKGSSYVSDFIRGRPIVLFAAVALLCSIGLGAYVYLQIATPGTIARQGTPPAPQAAPEAAPVATVLAETASAEAEPNSMNTTATPVSTTASQVLPAHRIAEERSTGVVPRTDATPPNATHTSDVTRAGQGRPARKPIPSSALIATGESETLQPVTPAEPRVERTANRKSIAPRPEPTAQAVPKAEAREQIAVSPAASQSRINAHVSEGYALLQAGNVVAARAAYSRAIEAEPLDIDALLGLAYIASQEHRSDEAVRTYLRILQLNPRHAIAQGALIGAMGRADPAASETRLKQLLSREPSPFLHFVLGNLYSDQSLWSQAQQSYFQAHHLEPDNPDYAYNLAVGLDHLRQSKLALDYYRRAEQLAALKGRASFDVSHARARIGSLSSELR